MTPNPQELFRRAASLGLRLEPRGEKLAVIPANRVPPDFADVLRQHKAELLDWLEAKTANLPTDQAPWLHIARQVMEGEFDGTERSAIESLVIGLRNIRHPLCRQALARLAGQPLT